jgi:hypothetical protein
MFWHRVCIYVNTTINSQFSHKQLVLVNGPCLYRGHLFLGQLVSKAFNLTVK